MPRKFEWLAGQAGGRGKAGADLEIAGRSTRQNRCTHGHGLLIYFINLPCKAKHLKSTTHTRQRKEHGASASTGPHLEQRAAHALRQGAVDHSAAVAHQVHQLIVRHRRMVHDAGPSHAPIVGSFSAGSVGRLHVWLCGGSCGPDALEEPVLALLMQACAP